MGYNVNSFVSGPNDMDLGMYLFPSSFLQCILMTIFDTTAAVSV